jgi:hypothetical protein
MPLDCASGSVSGAKLYKTTRCLSITQEEGAGAMMSGPLVNGSSQTAAPFQFPFIVLLHDQGAFFNFNPLRLLQLQSSLPTSSHIAFNFNPRFLQLQSLLPTSSLVANFNPRHLQLQPSSPFNFQTPSLFYFLPFSLMPVVCLMQLLPDELVTQIIIHSIKDKPVFHFLNLHNKICGTFQRICDSDEVLLHMSLCDLCRVCKNRYVRSCFEWRFREADHSEALCFEGMERLMRQRNPDKGMKLIGDIAAKDFGAKCFLTMLKYRCNPVDPKVMALLQKIRGGSSPPDGRWKNHNLRRLRYLVNQDLDNIAWWYWLDDGNDDILLLPVQNPHICIWAVGCRCYGPDTKEIIHYCSTKCHIHHEFDLWMRSFRPAVDYAVSRMNIGM